MKLLALALCALLTGCTSLSPFIERGGEAYDQALVGAEEFQCRIASARSVFDRYARDEKTWAAWLHICGYSGVDVPRPVPSE